MTSDTAGTTCSHCSHAACEDLAIHVASGKQRNRQSSPQDARTQTVRPYPYGIWCISRFDRQWFSIAEAGKCRADRGNRNNASTLRSPGGEMPGRRRGARFCGRYSIRRADRFSANQPYWRTDARYDSLDNLLRPQHVLSSQNWRVARRGISDTFHPSPSRRES